MEFFGFTLPRPEKLDCVSKRQSKDVTLELLEFSLEAVVQKSLGKAPESQLSFTFIASY